MIKYGRLAESVACVQALIEIYGDSRVLIEHHKGIAQYGDCQIGVKTKSGSVLVCGARLTVLQMTKEKLVIGGVIENVRICKGR